MNNEDVYHHVMNCDYLVLTKATTVHRLRWLGQVSLISTLSLALRAE